ncbi:MAG: C2H2-type zinc finger protein [Endozoicomonadaceae bacterium]|nr:C2H2-type zinc finger protein [Endozoicomonadaceae bacterium]
MHKNTGSSEVCSDVSDLHQCDACHQIFTQKSYLNRHNCAQASGETKKPLFECEECNACFHKPSELTRHQVIHKKEKPFQCKICKHAFKHNSYLKKHVANMHQNTDFSKVCSGVFESEEQLEQYKNSILNKKSFKCDICTNSFNSEPTLIQHKAEEHQQTIEELSYKCTFPGCHKFYIHKRSLQLHKELKHLPCGGQVGRYKALKLHRQNCETCQNFKPTIQSEAIEIKRLSDNTISSATDIANNTQPEKNELVCAEKQSARHHDQDAIFLQSITNNQVRDEYTVHNYIESLNIVCSQIIAAMKNSLSLMASRINDKNCDTVTSIIDSTTIKENISNLKKLFLQFKFIDSHWMKNKNITNIDMMYNILGYLEVLISSNLPGEKSLIAYILQEINKIADIISKIFVDWQLTLKNENHHSTEDENISLPDNPSLSEDANISSSDKPPLLEDENISLPDNPSLSEDKNISLPDKSPLLEDENFSSCISDVDFSLDDYLVILPDQPEWQQTDNDILSDPE